MDIAATKFWVYVIAAFGCGVVGALYFLVNLRISPDAAFGVSWTAFVIFIVVIGGIGTIEGPIIGTLLFFVLRETLADFGTWYLIVLGLVAVVVMVRFPRGLWGYVARALRPASLPGPAPGVGVRCLNCTMAITLLRNQWTHAFKPPK